MTPAMTRTLRIAPLVLATLLAACGAPESPSTAPATSPPEEALASTEVGLRWATLPGGIRIAERAPGRLRFDAASDGVPGTIEVAVAEPAENGVNLVATANDFGEGVKAAGGDFFGGNQIVTPFGSAYSARVLDAATDKEEIRIFFLHPAGGDRLVTLAYSYPPGEPAVSRARMNQALEFLAAMEPLPVDEKAPADAETSEDGPLEGNPGG